MGTTPLRAGVSESISNFIDAAIIQIQLRWQNSGGLVPPQLRARITSSVQAAPAEMNREIVHPLLFNGLISAK
jgi:hypothetical protein